jgi:hypothetical protein
MENIIFNVDLPFILSLSVVFLLVCCLAVCGWYCFRLLKKIYYITDTIDEINNRINAFTLHLSSVYNLNTFYGDETLHNLLKHGKELNSFIDDFMIQVVPDNFPSGENTPEDVEEDEKEETEQEVLHEGS